MDIRKKQRAVVDALEAVKARDIVVFNTERLSPFFERVIIASGESTRQVKALAENVQRQLKELGAKGIRVEGSDTAEWVLVDLGDTVVHVMHPAARLYYNLEEIWGGKAVTLKPPAASRAAPKPKPKPKPAAAKARAAAKPRPAAPGTKGAKAAARKGGKPAAGRKAVRKRS